ncbi:hypothetical protein [Paenibacillus sp.]|uniref:hypothetical protein n=1 Tax=Paenibacillus sp. TaxID=58172 RepID=UPI0028109E7F|nr:hypothetical protein [Paenibacillus sp.]
MKWGDFLGVTAMMGFIIAYEWPKMKQIPKKDKTAFVILLMIGWGLAMFDLQHMAGPATILEYVFKPFSKILETGGGGGA